MTGGEWRAIGGILGLSAVVLGGGSMAGLAAALAGGRGAEPVFLAMAGLGLAMSLAFGLSMLWAWRKAGPAPARPPRRRPPGAWAHATAAGLVIIGTGAATATGLNDIVWFGLSMAAAALYGVFVLRPRTVSA